MKIARLVGMLALLIVVAMAPRARGQQLGGEPGFDWSNPVNIQDAREYCRLFLQARDTGVVSPEFAAFQFHNRFPSGTMTPFYGAERVFKKIYASRLNTNIDSPNYYILTDLLRDDENVRAEFELYASTGRLKTSLNDVAATQTHLEAIADASAVAEAFTFVGQGSLEVVDEALESTGLVSRSGDEGALESRPSPPEPSVPDDTDPDQNIKDIKESLPKIPDIAPYLKDGTGPDPDHPGQYIPVKNHPGFECEDYALAWIVFLENSMFKRDHPDAIFSQLFVYYGTPLKGHAVVLILIGEKYYILDPQTGKILGPIDEGYWIDPTDFGPALKKLLKEEYQTPNPGEIIWEKHPKDYVSPYEEKPWYTSPDVIEWFRQNFPGLDPADFIRRGSGGVTGA